MHRALALLIPALLVALSLWEALDPGDTLPGATLRNGRIVLAACSANDGMGHDGRPARLLDDDLQSPALLELDCRHPEGNWLLIDLALSHWPSTATPQVRRSTSLEIYSGACTDCDIHLFRSYARPRRIRLQILWRRANNIDQEYIIPQAEPVFERSVELEDRPGAQRIDLEGVPLPSPSTAWPQHMNYIIAKLTVESIYPARDAQRPIAIAELRYIDRGPDGKTFVWR
ncbi:MAG: hypothetical protein K1X75_03525 [Leptospirales bacterium]|nr:hypothetical protein [Leptospirales bacterium]